jgi:hypothetical protein
MERKKASDYPRELLDLFDRYVRGGRRDPAELRVGAAGVQGRCRYEYRHGSLEGRSTVPWQGTKLAPHCTNLRGRAHHERRRLHTHTKIVAVEWVALRV